jgi:amino acid adenylation domain-containing protein
LALERDLIVGRWNDTAAPYERERSLQSLFNAAARENPDRVCCVCEGRSYTYAQLASAAHRIASALQTRGLSPGAVAAVFVGRTYCAIAAIAGIIGAGAAYLPLDRMYPRKRIAYLLADANPAFVLAERRLLSELPECSAPVLCIEELLENPAPAAVRDFSLPTAPCYLIYTSGSTGKPKGVALDHRGRVNNFSDFNRRFRIGPGDCVLGISSLSFDMSAYDILGTLMAGGKVVLVSEEEHSRPEQWLELMEREQVTLWHSVPSLMESFLDHIERQERAAPAPGGLRLVLLGGDWIPVGMAARIRALWPAAEVVSLGGATEVSMDSTIYSIDAPRREWKSVPYGRAMANQKAYVLDTRGDLMPIGIAGELFLGGDGVAWGYHKQPALTAAKFVPDGFTRSAGARLYATGDHARYQPDGQLELLGRMDFQVKIRGQRIELGEVEAAVQSFPGITRAVALVNKDERGAQVLTAYVVADRPLDLDALRKHLVEQLPVQMVPSQTLLLPQLPLSANGKVDRNALRQLQVPVGVAAAAREAPAVAAEAPAVAPEAPAVAPEAPAVGIVRSLFCEILSVPQVEAEEDFFALGGHSLLALRLISRLEEVFKIKTPLHVVFESPTAGKLAAYIEHEANQANLDLSAVKRLWQSVEQMSEQEVRDVALRERMSG